MSFVIQDVQEPEEEDAYDEEIEEEEDFLTEEMLNTLKEKIKTLFDDGLLLK